MQPLAAAQAEVKSPVFGGAKADLVALALAAAAAAHRATDQAAALFKDHWQLPEGALQVRVTGYSCSDSIMASSESPVPGYHSTAVSCQPLVTPFTCCGYDAQAGVRRAVQQAVAAAEAAASIQGQVQAAVSEAVAAVEAAAIAKRKGA